MTLISRLLREDDGQNLIEYALLAGLIALAAVLVIGESGDALKGVYTRIKGELAKLPGAAAS